MRASVSTTRRRLRGNTACFINWCGDRTELNHLRCRSSSTRCGLPQPFGHASGLASSPAAGGESATRPRGACGKIAASNQQGDKGQTLGLWEDAQRQSSAAQSNQAKLDQMRAEAAQREQSELREFVNAMNRLGQQPQKPTMYYRSRWADTGSEVSKHNVLGWDISDGLTVTTDAQVIHRSSQPAPTIGIFRYSFTPRYEKLPVKMQWYHHN